MNSHFSGLNNRDKLVKQNKQNRKERSENWKKSVRNIKDNNVTFVSKSISQNELIKIKNKILKRNRKQLFILILIFTIMFVLILFFSMKYNIL